jgi:hypothetical protein
MDGFDGYTTQIYLKSLSCALKMINFMLSIFYYNTNYILKTLNFYKPKQVIPLWKNNK